jgi:hypothetical protein
MKFAFDIKDIFADVQMNIMIRMTLGEASAAQF